MATLPTCAPWKITCAVSSNSNLLWQPPNLGNALCTLRQPSCVDYKSPIALCSVAPRVNLVGRFSVVELCKRHKVSGSQLAWDWSLRVFYLMIVICLVGCLGIVGGGRAGNCLRADLRFSLIPESDIDVFLQLGQFQNPFPFYIVSVQCLLTTLYRDSSMCWRLPLRRGKGPAFALATPLLRRKGYHGQQRIWGGGFSAKSSSLFNSAPR